MGCRHFNTSQDTTSFKVSEGTCTYITGSHGRGRCKTCSKHLLTGTVAFVRVGLQEQGEYVRAIGVARLLRFARLRMVAHSEEPCETVLS